jgi:hypothetical protein
MWTHKKRRAGLFSRLEHRHEPLLPFRAFLARQLRFAGIAFGLVAGSLALGAAGYHFSEGLPWLDATLNAAMLLGGMGPVDQLHTTAGKLFATFYALYAGLVFLAASAVLLAPLFHRFLHHFHLELESRDS